MAAIPAARVQSLFNSALDLPEGDRAAFLANECCDDPLMLSELRALLEMDKDLANKTIRPIAPELSRMLSASAPAESMVGLRVGAFELREELGRGGMGSVYRGKRVDGSVSQQAAIKFVRRELLDANTLRRFQIERQTLAALDHPNIARLLDAGELDDGTPYFTMEYVAGVPITDFCTQAKLGVRERVQLFRLVCAAVMQAHRSLVVHRDLKPSNILVNADGVPKLLDFGIAKPLNADFNSAAEEQTGTAQRYFSPSYSAPEQLLGGAIGVGCDVYALGLLLYELLAGTRPFDFTGLTAGQIERLVTTVPPDAPSITASKTDTTQALRRQLRGDLDGIVLRCLRKAANERYASVEQLDADLENYLEGRPVHARGGHGWYRAQKFVWRNKLAVATSAFTVGMLAIGIATIARQSQIARHQAQVAEQRASELQQVSKFQADMLGQVDPSQAGQLLTSDVHEIFVQNLMKASLPRAEREALVAQFSSLWQRVNATDAARNLIDSTILKPAAKAIGREFGDQPIVDAALNQVLANLYTKLGMYASAAPLQTRALDARKRELGSDHPDTLSSINHMGALLRVQGKFREAEPYTVDAMEKRRRILGEDHPDTLISINNMGHLLHAQGKTGEGEAYYREALEKTRRVLGEEHRDTLTAINNMALLLRVQGKLSEAEPYFREALEKRRRILGDNHPGTLASISNLGTLLLSQARFGEAEKLLTEALTKRRRVLGQEHPGTLTSLNNMGELLRSQGKLSQAEPYYLKALESSRRMLGDDYPETLAAIYNMGKLLQDQGKLLESRQYFQESLEKHRRVLGETNPRTLSAVNSMASLHLALGEYGAAAALLASSEIPMRAEARVADSASLSKFLLLSGAAHQGLGEFVTGEEKFLEAYALSELPPEGSAEDRGEIIHALIGLYSAWQEVEPGAGYDLRASKWSQTLLGLESGNTVTAGINEKSAVSR